MVSQINDNTLAGDNTLHVIGVISNPVRYHTRWKLFKRWHREMLETPNVKVYIVELAFGNRQFQVTDPTNPNHLQLRTQNELWHKENMLNIAVRDLLPRDWHYMCWCDTDISWPKSYDYETETYHPSNWAQETMHQLQHFHVVQPWQHAVDLSWHGSVMNTFESFCSVHLRGEQMQTGPGQPYKYAHSGFAWACTKEFWENLPGKGLMDWAIVGSADHHMAWAMINKVDHSVHKGMSNGFKKLALEWQDAAYSVTKGQLGYVKTRIQHYFHGPKVRRGYRERWTMFIEENFDPVRDIAYDHHGLIYLKGKPRLEHRIRMYMRSRNEDSIDETAQLIQNY
jgi:hypothetical protein